MRGLDLLRDALQPAAPTDPGEQLLELAKRFHVKRDVEKRRTPDGTTSVPLDELAVDPDYQRPPDREKIASMVEHRKAGGRLKPIKANVRPDGSKWITDGQHRAAAAAIAGDTHIDCQLTSVPRQDEPQQTEILAKVAADHDLDAIRLLLGAGAERSGKRLVLSLGAAGDVTYLSHADEWVGKTERGTLHVHARDARHVLSRLGLDRLSLQSGSVPPVETGERA